MFLYVKDVALISHDAGLLRLQASVASLSWSGELSEVSLVFILQLQRE